MQLTRFIHGCDTAVFYYACGLFYFLPISTGLTEWGSGLIIVTFFAKKTAVFLSENRRRTPESFRPGWSSRVYAFFRAMKPAGGYLSRPLALFIFINFLSVVFSQDMGLSFKGFMFKLLEGAFVYFGFMEGIKTKKQLRILAGVFLISAFVVGTNGIFQAMTGKGFIHGRDLIETVRVRSSLKHPNDFGGYLVMVIPLVLSMLMLWALPRIRTYWIGRKGSVRSGKSPVWQTLLLVMLALVLLSSLGLTFSRGAWLGLTAGMLFLGMRHKRTTIISAIVIFAFYLVFIPQMNRVRPTGFGRLSKQEPQTMEAGHEEVSYMGVLHKFESFLGNGMGRDGYWKEAMAIIRDYPVLGTGLNTYSKIGEKYRISWGGYPHNCYLHMTAETGFSGLLAFLGIIFVLYQHAWGAVGHITEPWGCGLLLGFLSGLTAFLVHSFFDTNLYSVQLNVLFWLVIAMIVKIQEVETG